MKTIKMQFGFRNGLYFCLALFLLVFPLAFDGGAADPAGDYPAKPIELVIHNAPGSSTDAFARLITDIIQQEKFLSQPVVVTSKVGGSGGVAMGYVFEKKGNPYVMLQTASVTIATPLLEKLPYNYKSFTPISCLCVDGSILVVRGDSPFKTIDDLIAEARKRPKELIQGCSSIQGYESLMGQAIQKAADVQWNIIPFKGGGQAILNLLGGHVTFSMEGPAEIREHVRVGKLRPLLAGAPQRYLEFPDVPTMEEKGLGKPISSIRGHVGPPDMPDFAVKKLRAVFKKVGENERFVKYATQAGMQIRSLDPADFGKYLAEENDRVTSVLSAMDLIKK